MTQVRYFGRGRGRAYRDPWRTKGLHNITRYAIPAGRADMLQWAIAKSAPFEKLQDVWWQAIVSFKDGHLDVLDLLKTHKPMPLAKFRRLFRNGLTNMIKDVRLLRWLDANFPDAVSTEIMSTATASGNLEMVQYLDEHHPATDYGTRPFTSAYEYGHFEIFRYLVDKRRQQICPDFVERLLWSGEKPIMKIMKDVGTFEEKARKLAVSWVNEGLPDRVLPRLRDDGLLPIDVAFSVDFCASGGKLDAIEFLMEHSMAVATTDAVDKAAERGKWDVVEYLLEHRSEGCTTRTMDAAATLGRLDLVKFLHQNRSEGCTTNAMDNAALSGHLSVVQFLVENRSEGCTVAGIKSALTEGHLAIVRMLYQHYPAHFGPEVLHDLMLHGAFDIWMELRALYPDEAGAVVEPVMLEAGKQMEMRTIRFVIDALHQHDIAYLAVDGATQCTNSRCEDAQWLRAVVTVTGPQSCRLSAVRIGVVTMSDYTHTRDFSRCEHLGDLKFLISACCESDALEAAITMAEERHDNKTIKSLTQWRFAPVQVDNTTLHPFLLDPRTPSWAVRIALARNFYERDTYERCNMSLSWPIRAIYRWDQTLLEVVRDITAVPSADSLPYSQDGCFKFDGSRAAAIRKGNFPVLKWLLENVSLPVESTLLDEAVYYHQFEIAEWLAVNCAEGCRLVNWHSKVYLPWLGACGLDFNVLGWVESSAAVRRVLDFGGIASYAAEVGELEPLKQLYATHREALMTRRDLKTLARASEEAEVIKFLEEIEYPHAAA